MRIRKRMLNSGKGATLVEVLWAILMFTLGIEALLAVYVQSAQIGKKADSVYIAYNLAKNHIERLKELNYALLPSAAETSTVVNSDGDPDPGGLFIRTTTVTPNYNGSALLTQVTIQVNYALKGVTSANPTEITTVIVNQ